MERSIFIAFLLFLAGAAFSQNSVVVDSLKVAFNSEQSSEKKALLLCKLSYEYRVVSPDSCLYFAEAAYGFVSKDTSNATYIKVLRAHSFACISTGRYTKAEELIQIVHRYYVRTKNDELLADCLMVEGNICKYTNQLQLSISKYIEATRIYEGLNHLSGMSGCYGMLGQLFIEIGEKETALEYTIKEVDIARALNSDQKIGHSLTNLGVIYNDLERYDDAEKCYLNSIEYKKKLGDTLGVAINLSNLSSVYSKKGDLSKAFAVIDEAHSITVRLNNLLWMAITEINMGDVLFQQKKYDQAIDWANKSLEKGLQINYPALVSACYDLLGQANEAKGNYKAALDFLRKYHEVEAEILADNNAKAIAEVTTKYETEKKDIEIQVLNTDKKLKDSEIERSRIQAENDEIQKYILFGGLALAILVGLLFYNRFQLTRKQKLIIEDQKEKVDFAFDQLAAKNAEITDSIIYAKRIQSAILPPGRLVDELLGSHFVLYKPKDIVAGDFYWVDRVGNKVFVAVADCTGHGVPGAMVSVVCHNALNRCIHEFGLSNPGEILDKTRELVVSHFEKSDDEVKDGMDICLVVFDYEYGKRPGRLFYAGANNPLWVVKQDQLVEYKSDKQPIGKFIDSKPFTTQEVNLEKGDMFYLFSDGYQDQFGGEHLEKGKVGGKKFKTANMKKLFTKLSNSDPKEQEKEIDKAYHHWRGSLEQIDDVCIIGVRV